MAGRSVALCIDVGASRPHPHPLPDGGTRSYRSGGSLKLRAVEIESGVTVAEHTAGQEFRREVAEQPPAAWLARAAREVVAVLRAAGVPLDAVTHLVNGFPAFIADNTAPTVQNLRYPEGGEWVQWRNVDLGRGWSDALTGALPNLRHVLVVNDLVLGIGAYLVERQASLQPGDHLLYVMPGGGLGVAEVLCLERQLLLMGSEQGHNFYVAERPFPGRPHAPERLEAGFCSATAFEQGYRLLTGRQLSFFEVVQAARAGDAEGRLLVDRFVEGLAYLTSHAVNRGINRIVLTGNVVRILNEAFAAERPDFLQSGIMARFDAIARMDLFALNRVRFEQFPTEDNTLGGIALIRAEQVAPAKGGLLRVPR